MLITSAQTIAKNLYGALSAKQQAGRSLSLIIQRFLHQVNGQIFGRTDSFRAQHPGMIPQLKGFFSSSSQGSPVVSHDMGPDICKKIRSKESRVGKEGVRECSS